MEFRLHTQPFVILLQLSNGVIPQNLSQSLALFFIPPPFHEHNNSITLFHAGKFVQLINLIINSLTVSFKYTFIRCQFQTQLFSNTLSLSCSVSESSTEPRTCSFTHPTSDRLLHRPTTLQRINKHIN